MSNTVATPILTINATRVNNDFPEGGGAWDASISFPIHQYPIRDRVGDFLLDKRLSMFDNIRVNSITAEERNRADYSQTAESVGLHQALF
jgi:hypothetical protein